MGELVSRLKAEGPQIWHQLSLFQRATLAAVGLAAVAAVLFLGQWAQQPEYSPAFTRLSESDASAIVTKLKEMKVPYELADGGATVRVPSDRVYDVRLQLASQGLPKGGSIGFELFDKASFGLTDFAQKLNFQRALEGELSRTIGRLSGVEEARVHVVLPQDELFLQRENPATASVVLRVRPGSDLDSRQIRGIVNLVSSSVEGLKPENVTVLDGDGVLLSGQEDGQLAGAGRTAGQREAQRAYERSLQGDIQAMLDRVLGPQKAVARVSATMDWDQYEANTETYSPAGKEAQIRSSRETVERSSVPLGEAATLASVPSYPLDGRNATPPPTPEATKTSAPSATPVEDGVSGSSASAIEPRYEKRDTTTNYEVSKLVERTVRAPGAVKRLSVAVMLDGQADAAMASTISKTVAAAVGLDEARGDTIVVTSLPFDRTAVAAQERATQETTTRALYVEIGKAVVALISLIAVLLLVRSLLKGLTAARHSSPPGGGLGRDPRFAPTISLGSPPGTGDSLPLLTQSEVQELAKTQPRLVAQIVQSWIDEK